MPEQILRLITFAEARRREGGRGRTTQWRDRQTDPDYPEVVWRGNRPYLVEHEHTAYLEKLIERTRASAPDAGNPAAAEAEPSQYVKRGPAHNQADLRAARTGAGKRRVDAGKSERPNVGRSP